LKNLGGKLNSAHAIRSQIELLVWV
jgi:hypothetical protein